MITYEWRSELTGEELDEVLELVSVAADFDHEAGFSQVAPEDVRSSGAGIYHLPIRARKDLSREDDAPTVIVAYLRIAVGEEDLGEIDYVVHPSYRSRGLTTVLVENVGLDTSDSGGWFGTGAKALRSWAYATHPAADRLTSRFEIPAVRRQWTESRHLTGPFSIPLEKVTIPAGYKLLTPHDVNGLTDGVKTVLNASELPSNSRQRLETLLQRGGGHIVEAQDDSGAAVGFSWFGTDTQIVDEFRAANIHALLLTPESRGMGLGRALMIETLDIQKSAGAQTSLIRVDPDDSSAVRLCRLLNFEQIESHSCYQVGQSAVPVPTFT